MTILAKNLETIKNLMYYYPDIFKEITIANDNLNYNGSSISLNSIDIWNIISSNEHLKNDMDKITMNQLFDILRLNESLSKQALTTNNANVYEHNNKVVGNLKENNKLMKNIIMINRNRDMASEQYFNIIDSQGNVHILKNDRGLDISKIYEEFIMSNNEENLDQFIVLIDKKLPQVSLVKAMDIEDKQSVSEDFQNKLNEVREEFDGKLGVAVYGNEKEDMIVIVDKLNPEKNEVRTYKRDENYNLVTEKYTNDFENVSSENKKEENQEKLEQKEPNVEETINELISYKEFKKLINLDVPLNDEQKSNVKLWEQTLGDIYVYEEYLSSDILKFLDDYRKTMEEFEINKQNGMINKNQENALNNYYEITNPTFKDAKLGNLSEEKKEVMKRKLMLETANKDGKTIIAIVASISIITLAIIIAFIMYMTK